MVKMMKNEMTDLCFRTSAVIHVSDFSFWIVYMNSREVQTLLMLPIQVWALGRCSF